MGLSTFGLDILGSRGASRGILLMWDGRVVEKIEDSVGNVLVACFFRSVFLIN
jgi:hypothetical protein